MFVKGKIYTKSQVAKMIGKSISTAKRYMKNDFIPVKDERGADIGSMYQGEGVKNDPRGVHAGGLDFISVLKDNREIFKEKNDYIYNNNYNNINILRNKDTNTNMINYSTNMEKIGKKQIESLKQVDLSQVPDDKLELLMEFLEHRHWLKKDMSPLAIKRTLTPLMKYSTAEVKFLMDKAIHNNWIDWNYPDALPKKVQDDKAKDLLKEIRGF